MGSMHVTWSVLEFYFSKTFLDLSSLFWIFSKCYSLIKGTVAEYMFDSQVWKVFHVTMEKDAKNWS